MSASSTGAWADAPNVDSPTTAKPSIALRANAGTSTPAMTASAATRPYAALRPTRSTPSAEVRCSRRAIAAETLVLSRNPCMRTSRMASLTLARHVRSGIGDRAGRRRAEHAADASAHEARVGGDRHEHRDDAIGADDALGRERGAGLGDERAALVAAEQLAESPARRTGEQ